MTPEEVNEDVINRYTITLSLIDGIHKTMDSQQKAILGLMITQVGLMCALVVLCWRVIYR
jgi:hypothetical protein